MGLLSVIGSVAGSIFGANSAKSVSADNIAAAREAMQNRHQWEVEDLKKAGLNPILSTTGSTGTISGSGQIYSPENPFANFSQIKLAKKRAEADINSANASAEKAKADADETKQRIAFNVLHNAELLNLARANSAKAAVEVENAKLYPDYIRSQIAHYHSSARSQLAYSAPYRFFQPFIDYAGSKVNSAVDALTYGIGSSNAADYTDGTVKEYYGD